MIVNILLPLILAFIMFSLGLGLKKEDFTRVLTFPKSFATGLFNQLLLLPLICFGTVVVFGIEGEIAVGMMILACCPGGVTTNVLTRISKGNVPLSISLTAVTSLLSIIIVPLIVAFSVNRFMGDEGPEINIVSLGLKMFLITAIPVLLGMIVTAKCPGFVERRSNLFANISIAFFVLIVAAALAKHWSTITENIATLGPALITLNLVLLALGLLTAKLLGLSRRDGSTIAIESGVQNGTVGITVGNMIIATTTGLSILAIPSAVYGITMYLVTVPFVYWRRAINKKQEN